jgi:hypothetical protein
MLLNLGGGGGGALHTILAKLLLHFYITFYVTSLSTVPNFHTHIYVLEGCLYVVVFLDFHSSSVSLFYERNAKRISTK